MPKPAQPGAQGAEASSKPNRGQDEQTHTFVNDAGETVEATMREFRGSLRDQGFRKADDGGEAEPVPPVE